MILCCWCFDGRCCVLSPSPQQLASIGFRLWVPDSVGELIWWTPNNDKMIIRIKSGDDVTDDGEGWAAEGLRSARGLTSLLNGRKDQWEGSMGRMAILLPEGWWQAEREREKERMMMMMQACRLQLLLLLSSLLRWFQGISSTSDEDSRWDDARWILLLLPLMSEATVCNRSSDRTRGAKGSSVVVCLLLIFSLVSQQRLTTPNLWQNFDSISPL